MEKTLNTNIIPEAVEFEEIAIELGVDPTFVEKDWFAVQAIKCISQLNSNFRPVFSGGTSLSKGFGLIERFSEDVDFKVISPEGASRKLRKKYREDIKEALNFLPFFEITGYSSGNADKYFMLEIKYNRQLEGGQYLRPYLKLEMSFQNPSLTPMLKKIPSFKTLLLNAQPETSIHCVSPIETAADKLSALLWRVFSQHKYDSTDMRHLHDLAVLINHLSDQETFIKVFMKNFIVDAKRGQYNLEDPPSKIANLVLKALVNNPKYRDDYKKFVESMSYSKDDDKVLFDDALESFDSYLKIISIIPRTLI